MARKPKLPPAPEPPARRDYGAWSIDYVKARDTWRVRPPKSVDPKRKPHYEKTRELAEAWARAEQARLARGPGVHADDITLGDYLGWWVKTVAASKRWSAGTVRLYEACNRRLGDVLLSAPLRLVRRDQLQARVAYLLQFGTRVYTTPPYQRGLASISVIGTVRAWRAAFQDATDEYDLIDHNPAARLKLPVSAREEVETWTREEASAIVVAVKGRRHEAIISLLFGGGIRVGEALALRWIDVDWQRGRISLHATGTVGIQEHTKSRRRRWVPVPPAVIEALRRQQATQTWPAEFVAEHAPGLRWNYTTVRKDLIKLCVEIGVVPRGTHAARHHAASYLSERGLSLAAVSKILGHGSAAITARTYLHASDREVERAAELLAELFAELFADGSGTSSKAETG